MVKKRRAKENPTNQQPPAEIFAEVAPISTPTADPLSPSLSPATTPDRGFSPQVETHSRRRGRQATVPESRNFPESIEKTSVAAVPNSTSPRLRKRSRPKSSEHPDHSPIPSEVADSISELVEEDFTMPTMKLRRLRKQRIREEAVDEQSEPAASTRSKRKKAEKAIHHETATHASDAEESQGEAPSFLSDDEVQARAGPSGASSSATPATDSTPQWASELIKEIKALGDRVTTLEDTIRRLISPSDS